MIKRIKSKLYKSGYAYQYDIRINGRRIQDSSFATRDEADAAVAALRQAARENRYGINLGRRAATIAQLVDARIKAHCPLVASGKVLEVILNRFKLLHGDKRIDQLNTNDLKAYAASRRSEGAKPSTINREFNDIRSCLRSAGEYFPQLERWLPPKTPRLKEAPGRERIIKPEEVLKLIARLRQPKDTGEGDKEFRCRQDLADSILVGIHTGMRRGEVMKLRWDDLNWEWRKIKVFRSKTQKVDLIDISDTLFSIFKRRKSEFESEWIFPGKVGPLTFPRHTLQRICKEIKLPYGRFVEGGFTFHDSRHTFVSQLLQLGYDLATIQSLSGHSNRTMALRYGHATAAQTKAAIAAIDKVWSPFSLHENPKEPQNPPNPQKQQLAKKRAKA